MKPKTIKYRFWLLISPYDGHHTEDNLTWAAAVEKAKEEIANHFHPGSQEKKLKQFLDTGSLTLTGAPGSDNFSEIFITTMPLTGPVKGPLE